MRVQLISPALLAAAILADCLQMPLLRDAAVLLFSTICGALIFGAAAIVLDYPKPWALECIAAARAVKPLPGKSLAQGIAIAVMGWWALLAAYLVAVALAAAVTHLQTGENQ